MRTSLLSMIVHFSGVFSEEGDGGYAWGKCKRNRSEVASHGQENGESTRCMCNTMCGMFDIGIVTSLAFVPFSIRL